MNRRTFLGASSGALATLAGCLGGGTNAAARPIKHPGNLETTFHANGDYPSDNDYSDGFPPEYGQQANERSVDESTFSQLSTNGESVTLVPIDVAHYWHQRQSARFVDARGQRQYERSHVFGSVLSPAVKNSQGGPIEGWPKDDRVVCYCGCPHHLSSIRAAGLQKSGFSNVYVIDEGFGEWRGRGYPMRGTSFAAPENAVIEGDVAAQYAGEYVWATNPASGQQEAAPIREDGSFELHLYFSGMNDEMPIRVSGPSFEVTRPLGELTAAVLTP
ncbi:rhodanese-like domain-containing protein [Halobacterium zhouii]|uniref:rhodanese-like domain-containing protein n=1 Tax=Halobacterium zhouii TaxID=2902624 RepID=UPI001E5DCA3C|nr:rhodanese-like domain-containing protein [Halobacterium zhouii]